MNKGDEYVHPDDIDRKLDYGVSIGIDNTTGIELKQIQHLTQMISLKWNYKFKTIKMVYQSKIQLLEYNYPCTAFDDYSSLKECIS